MPKSVKRAQRLIVLIYAAAIIPVILFHIGQRAGVTASVTAVLWVALAWYGARRDGAVSAASLRIRWPGLAPLLMGALLGLTLIPVETFLTLVVEKWVLVRAAAYSPVQGMMASSEPFWSLVLGVMIMTPIAEELYFRGYLLRAQSSAYGIGAGVLLSSVVFALGHGNPAGLPAYLVFGLVFALLSVKFNSVLPGIVTHMFINGYALFASRAATGLPADVPVDTTATIQAVPGYVVAVLAVMSVPAALLIWGLIGDTKPARRASLGLRTALAKAYLHWPVLLLYGYNLFSLWVMMRG